MTDSATVNVLGQYFLSNSNPYVVVHLFSKHALCTCTALCSPVQCVLAEQMYHYVLDAKSLLGCRCTVDMVYKFSLRRLTQYFNIALILCTFKPRQFNTNLFPFTVHRRRKNVCREKGYIYSCNNTLPQTFKPPKSLCWM